MKTEHQSSFSNWTIAIIIMLVQSANSLRVAVLGSGIAGSTAARTLADRGMEVTVFEAGRGIGGRTSTRITRDDGRYQFDHGGQYISAPKTDAFRDTLHQWKGDGWVKDWSGNFCAVDHLGVKLEGEDMKKERWVGYPAMNSICRNLLHHNNIRVELQTQANARRAGTDGLKWELIHGKSKKSLGSFDWLIATDRNSGAHYRKDLSAADVEDFRTGTRKIKSVKSLTAMVVFDKSLDLGMDGIQFDGKDVSFGSLGWAARDTSKPGRDREDGKECWVLQTHPDAAKEILKGTKKIQEVREKAKEVLVRDFLNSIPILNGDKDGDMPSVVTAIGHRWGAAFPIPSDEYLEMDSQLLADKNFVACGDYFGKLSGRIEGAYLSGLSAANQLYGEIQ
jgi:predicted NAD/FAD-dependent oxidoreductase